MENTSQDGIFHRSYTYQAYYGVSNNYWCYISLVIHVLFDHTD